MEESNEVQNAKSVGEDVARKADTELGNIHPDAISRINMTMSPHDSFRYSGSPTAHHSSALLSFSTAAASHSSEPPESANDNVLTSPSIGFPSFPNTVILSPTSSNSPLSPSNPFVDYPHLEADGEFDADEEEDEEEKVSSARASRGSRVSSSRVSSSRFRDPDSYRDPERFESILEPQRRLTNEGIEGNGGSPNSVNFQSAEFSGNSGREWGIDSDPWTADIQGEARGSLEGRESHDLFEVEGEWPWDSYSKEATLTYPNADDPNTNDHNTNDHDEEHHNSEDHSSELPWRPSSVRIDPSVDVHDSNIRNLNFRDLNIRDLSTLDSSNVISGSAAPLAYQPLLTPSKATLASPIGRSFISTFFRKLASPLNQLFQTQSPKPPTASPINRFDRSILRRYRNVTTTPALHHATPALQTTPAASSFASNHIPPEMLTTPMPRRTRRRHYITASRAADLAVRNKKERNPRNERNENERNENERNTMSDNSDRPIGGSDPTRFASISSVSSDSSSSVLRRRKSSQYAPAGMYSGKVVVHDSSIPTPQSELPTPQLPTPQNELPTPQNVPTPQSGAPMSHSHPPTPSSNKAPSHSLQPPSLHTAPPSRHRSARVRQLQRNTAVLTKNLRKGSRHIFSLGGRSDASKAENGRSRWREVVAFCDVEGYDISQLMKDLQRHTITCEMIDSEKTILRFDAAKLLSIYPSIQDHVYVAPQLSANKCFNSRPTDIAEEIEEVNCYVFNNGAAVLWGLRDAEEHSNGTDQVAEFLAKYSVTALRHTWQSRIYMTFCYIEELPADFPVPGARVKHERFYLRTTSVEEQVAASLALAQSTRLSVYEEAVEESIKKFGKLPLRIAANEFNEYLKYGSTEGTNIRKWVAEVYNLILDVNIVEDFLDIPEHFWHSDQFQPFWHRVHRYLDLAERIQILNVRVGCIQDILKVVSSERVEAQGFHLAWCVIILLVMNVVAIVIRETLEKS